MGVARSIEERLEGLVEGFFARVFRSGLQPVEVGRRILKEMANERTASVNRVYAPNVFAVFMAPEDHKRFDQMASELSAEFSELVVEQAKQNRWNLMGLPEITFHPESSLGRGEFRVDASLKSDPANEAPAKRRPAKPAAAELVVIGAGGEAAERLPLRSGTTVIGRNASCDVALPDANVSRRHAEIRRSGTRWSIVDLGSTNGTVLNGREVAEGELQDGDRIELGSTTLMFRIADEG